MQLPPLVQTFVLHFGEMGSRWGISRTVGQIYAVLFVSVRPLNADEIVERLGVSRSNVSMGLKELQVWNLVRLQHMPGDRRDYFTTPEDLWQIVRTLVEERKKREIDPTLTLLREILMRTSRWLFAQLRQGRTLRERHATRRWRGRLSGRRPLGMATWSQRKSPESAMCSHPTGEVWLSRSSGAGSTVVRKCATASAM